MCVLTGTLLFYVVESLIKICLGADNVKLQSAFWLSVEGCRKGEPLVALPCWC